jgi:plastocyanin
MRQAISWALGAAVAAGVAAGVAIGPAAADPAAVTLTLKDHRFSPAEITVPAGQKVRIVLINRDAATEEFDSHDLRVEQLVTPNGKASFSIGPLSPGTYSFMGEFHPQTAQGKVVAVPARP